MDHRLGTMPRTTALEADAVADVCVVGSGIVGLTTAYLLARAGRRVIVLEGRGIAGGESLRSTGHLVTALDDRYYELRRIHGSRATALAAQSNAAAIDRIESICRSEGIDCGFERLDGYLFLPPATPGGEELLARELDAARASGLEVERLDRAPVRDYDLGPCLRFAGQAQFHPGDSLAALATAIFRDGGRIATETPVRQVKGGSDAQVLTSKGHSVRCRAIVVATNTPINDRVAIHTKQAAYQTYVIAARIAKGSVTRALFWDGLWEEDESYHYVRLQDSDVPADEYLIVGGEDHKTGQADDGEQRFARLEQWLRERFPSAREIAYRWSGQVLEPNDGLALIGRNPLDDDNVFVATADSGTGLTHGTIAGILISDLITARENPWTGLYDASRKRLRAAADFARENLNAVAQYGDWLRPGPSRAESRLTPGSGAVIQRGFKKIACYRDESGALVERSAICRYLGCVVRWNSVERTWDCPCHGSRFDCAGHELHGPATSDLAPIANPAQTDSAES